MKVYSQDYNPFYFSGLRMDTRKHDIFFDVRDYDYFEPIVFLTAFDEAKLTADDQAKLVMNLIQMLQLDINIDYETVKDATMFVSLITRFFDSGNRKLYDCFEIGETGYIPNYSLLVIKVLRHLHNSKINGNLCKDDDLTVQNNSLLDAVNLALCFTNFYPGFSQKHILEIYKLLLTENREDVLRNVWYEDNAEELFDKMIAIIKKYV